MKKIIITILIGLFSCQMPMVNKDKVKDVKIENKENKPDFSGKDCIQYKTEKIAPEQPLYYEQYNYVFKSKTKKESPYLGKIDVFINPLVGAVANDFDFSTGKEIENTDSSYYPKIEPVEVIKKNETDLKKLDNEYLVTIKINNEHLFYISRKLINIIFNNSCEYEYLKSKVSILDSSSNPNFYEKENYFYFETDLAKEKLDIEKIESILHEHNKVFVGDIKKIEFSSLNALKFFLLFSKLSTEQPIFYKNLWIDIETNITRPA